MKPRLVYVHVAILLFLSGCGDANPQSTTSQVKTDVLVARKPTPAEVLDLSCWNLFLPTDVEGTGKANTIYEKEIADGFVDSENFYVNEAGDGVVFSAPIKGALFAHDIADLENHEASLLFRWCIAGKWKLLLTYDGEANRHKNTHPRTEKRPQLFDLVADPTEQVNLAAENPELVAKLVTRIQNWYQVKERKTLTKFE